jgi:GxxExxY protein
VKDDIFCLCDRLWEACFALHQHLRHGHLEKVYENGLANRIGKMSVPFIRQHPLSVFDYDGTLLGDFYTDFLTDNRLIIEIKACRTLANEYVAQLLGNLCVSRIEHGLLINFGSPRLQIRKFALTPI